MPKDFKVTKDGAFKQRAEEKKVTTPERYAAIEKDSGEVTMFKEPQPYFQQERSTNVGERRVEYDMDSGDLVDVAPTVEEAVASANAAARKAATVTATHDSSPDVNVILNQLRALAAEIPSADQGRRAKIKHEAGVLFGEAQHAIELLLIENGHDDRLGERQNQQSQGGPAAGNTNRRVETDELKSAVERAFNTESTAEGKRRVFGTLRGIINSR